MLLFLSGPFQHLGGALFRPKQRAASGANSSGLSYSLAERLRLETACGRKYRRGRCGLREWPIRSGGVFQCLKWHEGRGWHAERRRNLRRQSRCPLATVLRVREINARAAALEYHLKHQCATMHEGKLVAHSLSERHAATTTGNQIGCCIEGMVKLLDFCNILGGFLERRDPPILSAKAHNCH